MPRGARRSGLLLGAESLFEAIRLQHPVLSEIVIEAIPKLEPLLPALEPACVCVTLVNRRDARFFVPGASAKPRERHFEGQGQTRIHGQHRQGGWSEANYERTSRRTSTPICAARRSDSTTCGARRSSTGWCSAVRTKW